MGDLPRKTSNSPGKQDEPIIQEALGQSEVFLNFQERLSRVAKVDRPVLIIGERGTGKELAASRLHFLSRRWQEPFVALNCAALASTLIESELFGHEEGAFTGAARRRRGRFEAAHGGTLFLDEIGNIPVETQEKILRVVEYGSFERVGGSEPIRVNARILGATNTNLSILADKGQFMRDLLDRLSFEVLFIPPLRDRREDIMLLTNHFAARMAFELNWKSLPEFTDGAIGLLENHPWPGNVRELKNVIERAVYRSDDEVITADEIIFDPFLCPYSVLPEPRIDSKSISNVQGADNPASSIQSVIEQLPEWLREKSLNDAVREVEICLLKNALERARFNQRKAAELVGMTYHQFRGVYRKHREFLGGEDEPET
ncbi:MAG: hypothetical protein AMXMBFR84_04960 [Candidatus Hydrogenedentota bacterium]